MTLKEQALEHWRDNKERLKKMDWDEWVNLPFDVRRFELFDIRSYAPQISGKYCPYCQYYIEHCYVTISETAGRKTIDRCPLYESRRGECCKEWVAVRESLLRPTTKSVASRAINKMIKRLEAINE